MKRLIPTIIVSFFTSATIAQMPTVDAPVASLLGTTNAKLSLITSLQKTSNTNQTTLISNQREIIRLLQRQNEILSHLDDLKNEEIETYKEAPDNRIVAYQKYDLERAKTEIVNQARDLMTFIESLDKIKYSEIESYTPKISKIVESTILIYTQTNSLLSASDKIIPAKERQQTLENATNKLRGHISKLKEFKLFLGMVNKSRKGMNELFGQ